MMNYNEGGWLFQEGAIQLISREVQIKDLEDLIYMADLDNQWAENVREEVLWRDQVFRGEIKQDRRIDPILDEVRMWNAGGTVMQYPFGYIVTFPSRRHLFRGEVKRYPHTESSLSRTTRGMDTFNRELSHVLSNMRIYQFRKLLWNINVVPYWEAKLSEVNYKALAQHYGFKTFLLDLTNDFRTALFFATCKLEENKWRPLTQLDIDNDEESKYGVIYHSPDWAIDFMQPEKSLRWYMKHEDDRRNRPYVIDGGELDDIAFQIGLQPLHRCHTQSGYVYPMKTARSLDENPWFEKIYFSQSVEFSQRVFDMMHEGKDIYPEEGITGGLDIVEEIKNGLIFSEDDLLWAYELDECDKTLFPTLSDLKTALMKANTSIEFRKEEIDYNFTPDQLERINSQYDGKDLLDPVGGIIHQKPESIAYRERRCQEIFGKLI